MAVAGDRTLGVRRDVPLAPMTTLELGGPARFLIDARDEETVVGAVAWAASNALPLVVLGGCSNVVIADDGFDGVVLRMGMRGVEFHDDGRVDVAAGESWDALVEATVARGWAGIECLAGIPGLVGATPIQNVGAYGQEVAETIREVRALERGSGKLVRLSREACAFGYRDSLFRRHPDAYVVVGVTFALRPGSGATVRYRELREALEGHPASTLAQVAGTVRGLRRKKSMVIDPGDPNRRSVGSFFTNPVLDAPAFAALAGRAAAAGIVGGAAEIPQFASGDGRVKVPAGWLIERAGFSKGFRRGNVGVSSAHALALVHHGGGTTTALLSLADDIRSAVEATFGVSLSQEPIVLGSAPAC